MIKKILPAIASMSLLMACGGDDVFNRQQETSPTTVEPAPSNLSKVTSLVIVASDTRLASDADNPANEGLTLTIYALDENRRTLENVPLTLSSKGQSGAGDGILSIVSSGGTSAAPATGANGTIVVKLTTGGDSTERSLVVRASAGSVSSEPLLVTVVVPETIGSGPASSAARLAQLVIVPSRTQLRNDEDNALTEGLEFTVYALDANRAVLPDVPLKVIATDPAGQGDGIISPVRFGGDALDYSTDETGSFAANLTTGGDRATRTISLRASSGSVLSNTVSITVLDPSEVDQGEIRMGYFDDQGFNPGRIRLGVSSISSHGTVGLKVEFADENGAPFGVDNFGFTGGRGVYARDVEFSSDCFEAGRAAFSSADPNLDGRLTNTEEVNNGVSRITYTAGNGCEGTDTITARAVIVSYADYDFTTGVFTDASSVVVTAQAQIEIALAASGSLEFQGAAPTAMGLRGSGLRESASVTFTVLDPSGFPVSNRTVDFSLSTSVGGLSLDNTTATTDDQGRAIVFVRSGTVHTGVRVIASTVDPVSGATLTSQSQELLISSLLPDQKTFSISVDRPNWFGCSDDGVTYTFTARAADRFNNPVPTGTVIAFTSEAGSIFEALPEDSTFEPTSPAEPYPGGCRTSADGSCSVTLITQGQRPGTVASEDRCRVTVTAYTTGEESFIDSNGNGLFDDDELASLLDLSEVFVDSNEDGIFGSGEEAIDFNQNGTFDVADGLFTGLLCEGALCSDENATLNVFSSSVVVWSSGIPNVERVTINSDARIDAIGAPSSTAVTLLGEGVASISFLVRDSNRQPLPEGTTYTLVSANGNVGAPQFFEQLATTDNSEPANTRTFTIAAPGGDDCSTGVMTLNVAVPEDVDAGIGRGAFSFSFGEEVYPTPRITLSAVSQDLPRLQTVPIRLSIACPDFRDLDLQLDVVGPDSNVVVTPAQVTIPAGETNVLVNASANGNATEGGQYTIYLNDASVEVQDIGSSAVVLTVPEP